MAKAGRWSGWRGLLVGPLILIIVAGATLALDGQTGLMPLLKLRREVAAAEASLEELMTQRDQLRDRARRLREDLAEIEVVAREELGMVGPGEIVIRWSEGDTGDD